MPGRSWPEEEWFVLVAREKVDAGSFLVPHASASVGLARTQVETDLRARGLPTDAVEDSVLVVSEILSNSLKHARPLPGGKLRIDWELAGDQLSVQVTDGGSGTRPRVQQQSSSSTGGRGLGIVRRLSADWGFREQDSETTVWARIDLDARTVTTHRSTPRI